MKVTVKLAIKSAEEKYKFHDISSKYSTKSKVMFNDGFWAEIDGHDNEVLAVLCELCNSLVAE